MSDNYEVMQTFGFTYTDCEGKTYKKEIQTSGATWMECLNDYVRFLESIFQYEIMPKIRIEEPLWLDMMYEHYPDYNDPWKGDYFVKDEDTESTQEELDW
jgi:hypothetical protein